MIIRKVHKRFFWLIIATYLLLEIGQLYVLPDTVALGELVINEFVAKNETGLTDKDGDYSDWIEIYNPGRRMVHLAGWFLTDDPKEPAKWAFPDMKI